MRGSMTLNHLDLCSGIGGFALAARRVGFETKAFVEIDDFCQRVLRKNFPNVPIHSDIREMDYDAIGSVQLVTAGWPCQPHSYAGKRRGAEDDRYLWPEIERALRAVRPRYFVGENVIGIASMEFDRVLSDLERLGYSTSPIIIPALGVNARHKRERVWFVADALRGNEKMGGLPGGEWRQRKPIETDIYGASEMVPMFYRNFDGISFALDRLRSLGNAIVPQIATVIFDAIRRLELALET